MSANRYTYVADLPDRTTHVTHLTCKSRFPVAGAGDPYGDGKLYCPVCVERRQPEYGNFVAATPGGLAEDMGSAVLAHDFIAIPRALPRHMKTLDMNAGDRTVVETVWSYQRTRDGWAWPKNETMENECGLTRKAVQRHVARLEARGLLVTDDKCAGKDCRHGPQGGKHYSIKPLLVRLDVLEKREAGRNGHPPMGETPIPHGRNGHRREEVEGDLHEGEVPFGNRQQS